MQLHNVVFLLFKCVCLQFTAFYLLQRARKSEQFNLYNRKMNSRFRISIVQLYGNLETVSRYAQTRVVCILYIYAMFTINNIMSAVLFTLFACSFVCALFFSLFQHRRLPVSMPNMIINIILFLLFLSTYCKTSDDIRANELTSN